MATRRPRPEDSIPLEGGLSRHQIRLLHEAISIVNERRRKAPATTPALSRKLRALLGPDLVTLLLRLRDELRLLNTPLALAYLEASGIIVQDPDDWFRVPNIWKLPPSAAHRIIEAEADCISPRVRFATFRLKAEYEEMEKFVKEWNLDALPPPPPLSAPCPDESESGDPAAQWMGKGDTIAVRGSNGRGWFEVRVTGIDRCERCGAIIVWDRTEKSNKKIPLNPWPLGADEIRSHFKVCFRRRKPWGWPTS